MPQLNPSPWFNILMFTWLIFIAVIPPKILAHQFPNEFSVASTHKPKTDPWNWPWY
uniref:ATP synthase complex subunit 8 n=1 Tax=Enneanectes altivelis TaxID=879481 RepID=A0A8F5LQS8_9TELE|nr:ATP synthase F0 subunit 8 [Enneanectes altivelis]